MEQNKLFRKAALDKMSSPERLDVLMEVTSPKGWLALWTVGGIILGLIVWSIFGSIPTRVEGEGILLRGGSLRELQSVIDGELAELKVDLGDEVEEDEVVAILNVANRQEAVRAALDRYQELQREHETAMAEDEATIAGYRATIAGHMADRQRSADELTRKREELPVRQDQFARGIITKARLDQLQREIRLLESEQTSLNASITSIRRQITAAEQRIRGREMEVEAAKSEYERLTRGNIRDTMVRSPVAGRVVSLPHRVGDLVGRGEVVAMVEPQSAVLEPVLYVSSTQGGRILPDMPAEVSPTTVKREEFGFMRGRVRAVSNFTVSLQEMESVLGSQELAQEILRGGSKIEVRANLIPSEETPSGYLWSSSTGPNHMINSGTRITVSILVERRAPISYVLPLLRGTVGI